MSMSSRALSNPETLRLAEPRNPVAVSACTSISRQREPDKTGQTTLPLRAEYSAASSPAPSATSRSPPSVISNSPTSSVLPKRFLTPRTTRWLW